MIVPILGVDNGHPEVDRFVIVVSSPLYARARDGAATWSSNPFYSDAAPVGCCLVGLCVCHPLWHPLATLAVEHLKCV